MHNEFTESMDYFNDKFDQVINLNARVEEHDSKIKKLEEENKCVKKELMELKLAINNCEQRSRTLNIEIKGVPVKNDINMRVLELKV